MSGPAPFLVVVSSPDLRRKFLPAGLAHDDVVVHLVQPHIRGGDSVAVHEHSVVIGNINGPNPHDHRRAAIQIGVDEGMKVLPIPAPKITTFPFFKWVTARLLI